MIKSLTEKSVSILEIVNGKNQRVSYSNSENGRSLLKAEQPAEVVNAVLKVWGESAKILDNESENAEHTPTIQERINALENIILEQIIEVSL